MSDEAEKNEVGLLTAQAIAHHGAGRLVEAEACYRQALRLDERAGDALHGLGILEWLAGHRQAAQQCLQKAVREHPDMWRYACTLGRFWRESGDLDAAAACFERVLELQPDSLPACFDLASIRHAQGELAAAATAYRHVLTLQTTHADALNNLGLVLGALGRHEEAAVVLVEGATLHPDSVPLHNNLGNTLLALGRVDEASAAFRHALAIDANSAELWFNYGNALSARSTGRDTQDAYLRALSLDPQHVRAHVNLGNVLRQRGDFGGALARYQTALALQNDFADAWNNAGAVLNSLGRIDEAIVAIERAIALCPGSAAAFNNLGNAHKNAGRMDEAIACYRQAVGLDPALVDAHSNLLYALSFSSAGDDRQILAEARQFGVIHCHKLDGGMQRFAGRDRSVRRRLRIGYVSPDFREHCQSLFTLPLLRHHDHRNFEIHAYAQLASPDEISARIAGLVDVWRPTYGLGDAALAELIERDEIDILIDLTMHMAGGRPLLFARRPAPVQVAWLAYPGTTGVAAIDYRLTDPWLDPPELGDAAYCEQSLRLPDTFWCYDPLLDDLAPNELPAVSNGCVTFGCLNNFCKVTGATLDLWGRVMAGLPDSRLLLLAAEGNHRERVYRQLEMQGVTRARIDFVAFRPRREYLQTYHRIDLCLDTLPYNGHTTSLDAYWMGVPVVTLVGKTVAGRAGWSQLNNLGLPQLGAFDEDAFVALAQALAGDADQLAGLRRELRSRLTASALMDGKRFAAGMETALRTMWTRYCHQ